MKRGSHRTDQVAETIRQVLAEALVQDLRDPRIQRVSVTAVSVTADLSRARVRVMIAEGEDGERVLDGLRSAAGFLRTRVARALTTRVIPELVFEIDRGLQHAARIDALLNSLHEGEGA